jgi:hypothetical protein
MSGLDPVLPALTNFNSGDFIFGSDESQIARYDFLLTPNSRAGALLYPHKIRFVATLPDSIDDYLAALKSAYRRKIKRSLQVFAQSGLQLQFIDRPGVELLQEWLLIYQAQMRQKEDGRLIATLDKLLTMQLRATLATIRTVAGQLVGGAILTVAAAATGELQTRLAFASYEPLAAEAEAPVAFAYEAISKAIASQQRYFSFGKDTNLYGGHLSLGLRQYKRLFCSPLPLTALDTPLSYLTINWEKAQSKNFIFYYLPTSDSTTLVEFTHCS